MSWDQEYGSLEKTVAIPALSTGEMLGPSVFSAWRTCCLSPALMVHLFVGFPELLDSVCINPLLQHCSSVEASQK